MALASAHIARDADPDRATVVVQAELGALVGGEGGCAVEGGPVIHPDTARWLLCDGRLQTVVHDHTGQTVVIGRTARTAPPGSCGSCAGGIGAAPFRGAS